MNMPKEIAVHIVDTEMHQCVSSYRLSHQGMAYASGGALAG